MALSLPDARQLSDEVLEALRLRALRGCELGFTEADVADLLGVSRETVSRWWTAYADGGLEALPGDRTGRPVGSGRTLSDEQARHIQDLIDDHSPEELGIAAAVVDPQGGARPDPQGVRDRHAGADRRRVPQAVGLHGQGAAPPRQGPGPRGGAPSGWRRPIRRSSGGRPARGPRSTGATRPGRRPTSSRGRATPARATRRRSRCRTPTSG